MKKAGLYLMALAYVLAGINHFRNPELYLKIIPRYLPAHNTINTITGAAEIALGLLLLLKTTRNAAAWGIVLLLTFIFPANIQMAIDFLAQHRPQRWLALLRLPLQILLVWWALLYTNRYQRKYTAAATPR